MIENFNLDFKDKILFFCFIIFFAIYCNNIYNKWTSNISNRQHEHTKLAKEAHYLIDAWYVLRNWDSVQIYNPLNVQSEELNIKEPEVQTLTWHIQVAELYTLYSNQYKININNDWYEQEHCYISTYGQKNIPLAIFCKHERPSDAKINEFIKFAQRIVKSDNCIYIIAVKNGQIDETHTTPSGIEYCIVSEATLLNQLINFEDYYRTIRENYEKNPIMDGYRYTVCDIYTEPECIVYEQKDKHQTPPSIEEYIINWVNDPKDKKQLAILGEYGQGKSVLSQRLTYRLTTEEGLSHRIPIIIELRGKFPKSYKNILSFFSDWGAQYSIKPQALLKLYYAGKLLLIFEGFDEIEMVGDHKIRMEHFKSIWRCSTRNSKIIITGRPNYFSNDREQKAFLRTDDTDFSRQYCKEIHIQKFDNQRIANVLRNFPTDVKEEILDVCRQQYENSSFIDLISRPSSLFLTCAIWKERKLSEKKDNLNSSTIINEFLLHCYDRQEQKGYKEVILSRNERAYFMQGIAVGMWMTNKYTNQISEANLNILVNKLIENCPEQLSQDDINTPSRSLKKRYDKRYNEDDILLDIRTCGVLVRDTMTVDTFKFAHKSFLELLVSKYYTTFLFKDDYHPTDLEIISHRAIKNSFSIIEDELSQTPDVFQFIIEQCTHDLKFSSNITPNEKTNAIFKKICFTPININLYCKMMYLFGVDVKNGMLAFIGLAFILTLCVYSCTTDNAQYTDVYTTINYISVAFSAFAVLLLYYYAIRRRTLSARLALAFLPLTVERFIIRLTKSSNYLIPKFTRLLIFYVICKKYDIHILLQSMMPKFAYKELVKMSELMEKRFNGTENIDNVAPDIEENHV
ncbi:MAG: hypothetical protein IKY73_02590 [Bacteroidaceae bacterium]|nr:hypothetical protein [Bacteroidaceae bacterium]